MTDPHVREAARIIEAAHEARPTVVGSFLDEAPGRDTFAWETSVAEERTHNVHIRDEVSEDDFVSMRQARDSKLGMPRLLFPSIQVNMRGGRLPEPEDNGINYLKLPINML